MYASPTTPTGLRVDVGSITDLAPEFVLGGDGLGSLALDGSRAPTLLTETLTSASFRYWLTGVRGTGSITLTHLVGTWSYNVAALDNTTTTATATISARIRNIMRFSVCTAANQVRLLRDQSLAIT